MKKRILQGLLVLLGLIILGAAVIAVPRLLPASRKVGAFTPRFCEIDKLNSAIRSDVRCGVVTVPEHHSAPDGDTIQLAVMVIRTLAQNPAPDPLVIAEGGPGGSEISLWGPVMLSPGAAAFRETRDIVLIEQRGTYYASPNLLCDEVGVTSQLSVFDEAVLADYADCRARLIAEGIDLSAYNSLENAADVPLVVRALGYDEYNFYGVSYGTMLAQHLMQHHPDNLRSVILDSAVPLETNFLTQAAQSADRSFRRLFDACAADPYCAERYPDLEATLFASIDALNADPKTVSITDPKTEEAIEVTVTGDFLLDFVFQSLYRVEMIPLLPAYIHATANGDVAWIEEWGAQVLSEPTFSEGMFYSVICAEDADYTIDEVALDGAHPQIASLGQGAAAQTKAVCDLWDVPALPDSVDDPIDSDIPTLIMTGEFDPITPPPFGMALADHLPNSHAYEFPSASHGVLGGGSCPIAMFLAFLDDPDSAPDASCIDAMAVRFREPLSEIVLEPVTLDQLGMRFAMPRGWAATSDTSYSPVYDDRIELRFETLTGTDTHEIVRQHVINQAPDFWEKVTKADRSGREWHLWQMLHGDLLSAVIATEVDGMIYVITLQAPQDVTPDLSDAVLIPALEDFEVVE